MPHGALLGYAYLQGHDLYQDSTGHSVKRAKGGSPRTLVISLITLLHPPRPPSAHLPTWAHPPTCPPTTFFSLSRQSVRRAYPFKEDGITVRSFCKNRP